MVEFFAIEQGIKGRRCCSAAPACETHINVRGSLRILNFTPWSAKDLDKNVDSAIPGKLLGGDTKKRV